MSLLSSLMRTGIATKVMREARKPKNQEKAKQLFNQARNKVGGGDADRTDPDRSGPTAGGPTGSAGSSGPTGSAGSGGPTGPVGSAAQDGSDPVR